MQEAEMALLEMPQAGAVAETSAAAPAGEEEDDDDNEPPLPSGDFTCWEDVHESLQAKTVAKLQDALRAIGQDPKGLKGKAALVERLYRTTYAIAEADAREERVKRRREEAEALEAEAVEAEAVEEAVEEAQAEAEAEGEAGAGAEAEAEAEAGGRYDGFAEAEMAPEEEEEFLEDLEEESEEDLLAKYKAAQTKHAAAISHLRSTYQTARDFIEHISVDLGFAVDGLVGEDEDINDLDAEVK